MTSDSYYYPNRMGRIILDSMQEVVGRNGLNVVLNLMGRSDLVDTLPPNDSNLDFSFATVSGLLSHLEQAYGPRGGRGLATRIGRAAFKYGMREFGPQMGLAELAFRIMPFNAKVRAGGHALAELFNQETDQRVRIEAQGEKLFWIIERCPLCWERRAEDAVCHLAVGLLQESLYWMSSGKIFNVEETRCIAKGDHACIIEIDQTPLA